MQGVSLFGLEAIKASFKGTDLRGATLELGNFTGADFSDALLEGAFVNAANFERTKLTGSDWTDVLLRKDQMNVLCGNPTATGTNSTTGESTRETLNCPN